MKTKKSRKAELETKKGLFFRIGLLLALSVVYMAFQVKTYETVSLTDFNRTGEIPEEELAEVIALKPELPPPPPPKMDAVQFDIVEDDIKVDDIPLFDPEAGENVIPEPFPGVQDIVVPTEEIDEIIELFDEDPAFIGGESARLQFLRNNIKYPKMAIEAGITGTVYVGFVVEKDGSISNVTLLRGIGGGCDEEAMRVTAMMPKWKPGLQQSVPIRGRYRMPIKFTLN